jgi:hypothetical protein
MSLCPCCSPSDHRELKTTLAQHVYTDAAAVVGQAKVCSQISGH